MEITNYQQLEVAIGRLKLREQEEKEMLVEQFHATVESFKPINLIKKAFGSIKGTELGSDIINAAVGIGAGLLSKNVLIGKSTSVIKRILGTALEVGVAKAVSLNTDKFKSVGSRLVGLLLKFRKGKKNIPD